MNKKIIVTIIAALLVLTGSIAFAMYSTVEQVQKGGGYNVAASHEMKQQHDEMKQQHDEIKQQPDEVKEKSDEVKEKSDEVKKEHLDHSTPEKKQ